MVRRTYLTLHDSSSGAPPMRDKEQTDESGPDPEKLGEKSAADVSRGFDKVVRFLSLAWSRHGRLALLLVAVTFVAYLPTLRDGFIWDDDVYVTGNSALHNWEGLRE